MEKGKRKVALGSRRLGRIMSLLIALSLTSTLVFSGVILECKWKNKSKLKLYKEQF